MRGHPDPDPVGMLLFFSFESFVKNQSYFHCVQGACDQSHGLAGILIVGICKPMQFEQVTSCGTTPCIRAGNSVLRWKTWRGKEMSVFPIARRSGCHVRFLVSNVKRNCFVSLEVGGEEKGVMLEREALRAARPCPATES